jgi:prepilin-type N-terminal cleavage/methylation domain-containing protein
MKHKDQKKFILLNSDFFILKSGFTLFEVIVSIALLSIALAVILQLFSANLRGIATSDAYVDAVIKAESIMREILDNDELTETSWKKITEDGYTIDASITSTAVERTESLLVELLDIHLTINWTEGVKERSISLKTLKVVEKEIL